MRAVTLNYLSTGSGTDQTDHSAETGSLAERPLDELIACHGHILLMLKPVCDGAEGVLHVAARSSTLTTATSYQASSCFGPTESNSA